MPVITEGAFDSLLIDTNLLVLLAVGHYQPRQIPLFKRTCNFTYDDYYLLNTFANRFKRLVTLPNILTEVSNLLGQLPQKIRVDVFTCLPEMVALFDESYFDSQQVTSSPLFPKFGLTDAAIALLAKEKHTVLTVDLPLYSRLLGEGIHAINFNHLRKK